MNTDLPKPKRGWGIIKKGTLQKRFYESVASVVCDYNVKRANASLRRMYADGEYLVPVELRPVERGGCGWLTYYDGQWIFPDCPDKTRDKAWHSALLYFGLIGWGIKGEKNKQRFDDNATALVKGKGVQIARVELVALREPGRRNPVLTKIRRLGPTWDQQIARWCRKLQHPDLEFVPVEPDEHDSAVEEIRYRGFRIGRRDRDRALLRLRGHARLPHQARHPVLRRAVGRLRGLGRRNPSLHADLLTSTAPAACARPTWQPADITPELHGYTPCASRPVSSLVSPLPDSLSRPAPSLAGPASEASSSRSRV